jgi:uncharacterized protein YdaL
LLLTFTALFFFFFLLHAKNKNILIVYDGITGESPGFLSAGFLNNLLGHFSDLTIRQVAVNDYHSGQIHKADLIFVFFENNKSSVPGILLFDLLKSNADIVWVNHLVTKFLNIKPGKYGFSCNLALKCSNCRLRYHDREFPKSNSDLNLINIIRPTDVRVYSTVIQPDGIIRPYIIKSRNLWYIADSPFSFMDEGGPYLILADLLHDIIGQPHAYSRLALVRLEDINAMDDPARLRDVADYLARRKVPFQISVIPIFRDPANQIEVYLHEKPEMAAAIRYAVSKGGTPVMHGVSHQYRGQSGDDYEFWDDVTGKPIAMESSDWIDQRLLSGLSEMFANGIYPLAWETPHYAASQSVYRSVSKYFDTFNDRLLINEKEDSQQIFPFFIRQPQLGIKIIPENLGYIPIEKPDPQLILDLARRMWIVRDGVASFFFHPFMPIKYLKTVVSGMQEMGWTFVSLRDFGSNLRTDSQWVTSTGGSGKIVLANQYLHEINIAPNGRSSENYSANRMTKVLNKKISITRGSLYVMEAVDVLPEKSKSGFWLKIKTWMVSLFHHEAEIPLKAYRALIVHAGKAALEDKNDQNSFESVLRIFGFNPATLELGTRLKFSLEGFEIIVVPNAAAKALMNIEINTLIDFVEKGGILITDGRNPLSEKLGIHFENRSVTISEVRELSLPVDNVRWPTPARMSSFSALGAVELAKVAGSDRPLVICKPFGRGKVLFFGTLLDPFTSFGISRYPYFPYYLKNFLDITFNTRRNNLEFYFDPGLRQNISWENLVKRWKKSGVRIVYLAAWHFWKSKYEFDYPYFIKLCHSQGIAVYAWFEIPHVTPRLWDENPQWREINANGSDQSPGWRKMINLFHPQARQAVREFFSKLLLENDWDGVNLAELSYDTRQGLRNPGQFQPMNDQFRAEFKKRERFDPRQLFQPKSPYYWQRNRKARDKFIAFRAEKVRDLHVFFLDELEKIRRQKNKEIEIIVTVLDSLLHPEIVEEAGVNSLDIIKLMDHYDFTLQVEDPARSWADSPDRYLKYFTAYKSYIKDDNRLMFDINVVNRGDIRGKQLPSPFAGGMELAATLYYASAPCGRTGIYCEATVNNFDMDILPFVLGSDAEIKPEKGGYRLSAHTPFILALNDPNFIPVLDNDKWPFYGSRGISVPSGTHYLQLKRSKFLDFPELQALITFDGDIYDLTVLGSLYSFRYNSPIPVSLGFNRPLESVRVDGRGLELAADRSAFILPKGRHQIEIYTESSSIYAMDIFGYLSSYIFYILGSLAVGLLAFFYIYSRVKR